MAAGQGFKTFTTGEVLTATDVNGYLMQGVLVFASATARDAAITSPQEGQFAYTKDVNGLWYYDGATWVASGATGDIEGVTAGTGISGGGTSGTVTITNSMATAIDAKGDLIAGTGADAFDRLAIGTDGQLLTADSTASTGIKWASPTAAGDNYTLVGSATLSGSNVYTISGISNANKVLIMYDNTESQQQSFINIRFNTDSSSKYYYTGSYMSYASSWTTSVFGNENQLTSADTSVPMGRMSLSAASITSGYLILEGCNTTGKKVFHGVGSSRADGQYNGQYKWLGGYYDSTSTISSISIIASTLNFDGGLLRVFQA
jgi:hypothetical protein